MLQLDRLNNNNNNVIRFNNRIADGESQSQSMPTLVNMWLNNKRVRNNHFSVRRMGGNNGTNVSSSLSKKKNLVAKVPRHDLNKTFHKESIECLKTEAEILSILSHEHIIKIHGVSSFVEADAFAEHNYFIILEELTTTLDQKLIKYCKQKQNETAAQEFYFLERLDIVFDLASALKYMHEKGVIHRDIKPANVGFDSNGDLKLFDFGLAIQINNRKMNRNGLYDLDGGFGTCRYMAPEVAKYKPYNSAVDVYSYAVLMWEVLSLKKPFEGYQYERWLKCVVKGERPKIDSNWSESLQLLIENCWSTQIMKRYTFDVIVEILRELTCDW